MVIGNREATSPGPAVRERKVASLETVRLAVIGCGAVARDFHIPVLAGHPKVKLAALVDRNVEAAAEVARAYGVAQVLDDYQKLDANAIDAAVVATPPHLHAALTVDLARKGIHVLVEKPMAVTAADAAMMVQAAEEAGVALAVGHFRRLFPSSRMLRAALEQEWLGRPLTFDVEEGHVFNWPSVTLGSMRKDLAGGGVLIDTGSHVLDQFLALFPGPVELLDYRDNSLGGIEAECYLDLRVFHQGQPVEGRITLSRTRTLRNSFRIRCERGTLELPTSERERVTVLPDDKELLDPAEQTRRPYSLHLTGWAGAVHASVYGAFREEIDDWLDAIRSGRPPYLNGASVVPVVQLIEDCYRRARPVAEPWVQEGFRADVRTAETAAVNGTPVVSKPAFRRVLVTGAAGFIGCRVVELLRFREGWDVRALVHNPGGASRLARLPVEMVLGDLRSPADMARVVEGCDAVIHCAYGTAWGRRREILAVTVDGTRHLANAARAAGVRRFVHLSTIAVHGLQIAGDLDESTPVRPAKDVYAESKAAAERVVAEAAAAGLCAVTLRLANVYGPFSGPYTIRPVGQLVQGIPVIVGAGDTPSNTVYVDNVVEAIVRGLTAPAEAVTGQTFTISDGDAMTWAEFYRAYAEALGLEMHSLPMKEFERLKAQRPGRGLIRWCGSWFRAAREILTAAEFKELGVKVMQTDPIGYLPRKMLERFPGLRRRLRRLLKVDRPLIYHKPEANPPEPPPLELLEMYACPAWVRIDKARRVLGYAPTVGRERALELTLAWVKHARLVNDLV